VVEHCTDVGDGLVDGEDTLGGGRFDPALLEGGDPGRRQQVGHQPVASNVSRGTAAILARCRP